MASVLLVSSLITVSSPAFGTQQDRGLGASRGPVLSPGGETSVIVPSLVAQSVPGFLSIWAFPLHGIASTPEGLGPAPDPPLARSFHDLAYDKESDRVILFGGRTSISQPFGDTWEYDFDTNNWTQRSPASGPSARFGHAMVYLPVHDRVVLFGGFFGGTYSNETWEYDYNSDTWTILTPGPSPSPRAGHAMVYDAASDRVVLFGGKAGGILNDETWAYDFESQAWTQMNPLARPGPRERHRMAYVDSTDRIVLFGGSAGSLTNETWTYDVDTDVWLIKNPETAPSGRHGHGMDYDVESDRVILFSGDDGGENTDTWSYNPGGNTWTGMSPLNAPSGRAGHKLAYDSSSDRLILFGGEWPFFSGSPNDQTWAYDRNSDTWIPLQNLPSAPEDLEASPGDGRVDLSWNAPSLEGGSPIVKYTVYRGGALLTEIPNPATLNYGDVNVTEGGTYQYQVSASNSAGEGPQSDQVSVTVPDVPPSVAITSPMEGAILASRSVSVTGTASDNVAVARVEIRADGADWVLVTGTTTWTGPLDLAEGSNTIHARAQDVSGIQASASVSVVVDTVDPTVTIVSPAGGETLPSRQVTVTGTASDNLGLARVEVSVDGVQWVHAEGTTSWTRALTLAAGSNTIMVRATDVAGNMGSSSSSVTVSSGPNLVWIIAGGAAAAAAVAIAAAIFLRRRRKP